MKRHIGNPVSGEQFWPRPDIVDPLMESIAVRGESHKLFGLRRIGKSSVMKECGRLLEARGCIVVHVNAEDFGGCDSLFTGLLAGIKDETLHGSLLLAFEQHKALPSVLLNAAKALLKPGSATPAQDISQSVRAYWPELSKLIGEAIRKITRTPGKRVVLFLDELPFMLQNMLVNGASRQEVESLLAGLRSWRQDDGLVMVLAGSLGMGWLMRQHQLPSVLFNNLNSVAVPPLQKAEAQALIDALLLDEPADWWKRKTTTALLQELERHALYPIFVQTAFGKIKDARAATPEAIARVFREKIEPDLASNFYKQFNDRLKRYDEAARTAAHGLFDALLAEGAASLSLDQACGQMPNDADGDACLNMLQEDGFLSIDYHSQAIRPTSPLVSAWWRSYRLRLAGRRAP